MPNCRHCDRPITSSSKSCEMCHKGLQEGMRYWSRVMMDQADLMARYRELHNRGKLGPVGFNWWGSAKMYYRQAQQEHDRLEQIWQAAITLRAQDVRDQAETHADAIR